VLTYFGLDLCMTSAGSSLSSGAFATPEAGSGYFATAEHYRHSQKKWSTPCTGEAWCSYPEIRPRCLPMAHRGFRNGGPPRAVIEIAAALRLDFSELYAAVVRRHQTKTTPGDAEGEAAGPHCACPGPIYVLTDADRLSDVQDRGSSDADRRPCR